MFLGQLSTVRLLVRPFTMDDLAQVLAMMNAGFGDAPAAERRRWLEWTIMSYEQYAHLYQPPFGERAVALHTGEVVGSVGIVPSFGPFETLPTFQKRLSQPATGRNLPMMGLFWAVHPDHRGHGYASEAARALIDHLFRELNVAHVVATTDYDNHASIGVMRQLGMTIERNPHPTPHWFQVVGILENR